MSRYLRQEQLFGASGQARLASTYAVIAGLGGLGSHVAQQLAYLGVKRFGLIDDEPVDATNLNRLVGAGSADVGRRKVEVAEAMIKRIMPEASVASVVRRLPHADAASLLDASPVVFGCLDNDAARLSLTEDCSARGLVYFDLASDTGGNDDPWYGGRVVFCDGQRCLVCLKLLSQRELAVASMTPDQRRDHAHIYGVDVAALEQSGPSVVSVNGVVASLAVTEFMVWRTGLRAPRPHVIYRADLARITVNTDPPDPDCYYCQGRRPRA